MVHNLGTLQFEPIFQVGECGDWMTPRYTYHKLFTVRLPDICEWQNGFKLDMEGVLVGAQMG